MATSQPSFSDIEHDSSRRSTRRSEFLHAMDEIIVWDEWVGLIKPFYYERGGRGRPARELETMLRMYLLQVWYSLSDVACEEACIDIWPMHRFLRLRDADGQVPDATTLANFRHMMEENKIDELLFSSLRACLEKGGVMYKGGSIMDATFIESSASTKNAQGKRDEEMHQAKKGRNWHHGMKLHIGVDAGTGLIHSVSGTAANVHDLDEAINLIRDDDHTVYADSGYTGIEKRPEIQGDEHLKGIDYRTNIRKGSVKTDFDRQIERRKSSVRSKVEHPFHTIKDIFGLKKTPYRGIHKNLVRLRMAALSANLYMLAGANRRIDGTPLFSTA